MHKLEEGESGYPAIWAAMSDCWDKLSRVSSLWWARQQGLEMAALARQQKLASLVHHARSTSPLYAELYRDLPDDTPLVLADLPVTHKRQLMARFDDWVTDPEITWRSINDWITDPAHIGDPYLGRYSVWKSSGSTGEPGIFVQDENALANYDALLALQLNNLQLAAQYARGYQTEGGRAALVAATGHHFATIAFWQRFTRRNPWLKTQAFSVMTPLPQLVAALNEYQPAFLSGYPTLLAVLASEQAAGRLHLHPSLLWSGGETLSESMRRAIETAFDCPLLNEYGSSECLSIAFGCPAGWLHLNQESVILEPVDADGTPTPPGECSASVLLTNLSNRVQPLLRYDLGDRVLFNPEPCACGNPLPALRVTGRQDDTLWLRASDETRVPLLPMALTTVVEEDAGLTHFQIVQEAPDRLALRVAECNPSITANACAALQRYLGSQSLSNVAVVTSAHAPQLDPSGKLRQVICCMTQDK
ncbi:MAG: phenylacetate--CoA ligase family protein [Burkholderiaceae bacterium]|nr:MAG: phenylacetate--CoA ligase family protein [Burkholderiaceae bacterium]